MSFDNPAALWGLALALPILLVHLYRGRLHTVSVPSLLFWDATAVEEERISALRRLRRYASLVLNLLLLLGLISMVASPNVRGWTHDPERFIFVLDSDSLSGVDARQREARSHVGRYLEALHPGDEVALFDGSGLLAAFTKDRETIREKLEAPPRRGGGKTEELAARLRTLHPGARVLVVGASEPLPNLAVTSARVEGGEGVVRIEGFGWSGRATLRILDDRGPAREWTANLTAETPAVDVRFPLPEEERIRVEVEPRDDQASDNVAFLWNPKRLSPFVLVVCENEPDPFLWKALQILKEGGEIRGVGAVPFSEYASVRGKLGEEDVTITEGGTIDELPLGTLLALGTAGPEWTLGNEVTAPLLDEWDRDHPLLQGANLPALSLRSAVTVAGGGTLVSSGAVSLGSTGGRRGRAWAALGFRLHSSDLWGTAAFPLLLRNLVSWSRGGATRSFPAEMECGAELVSRHPLFPAGGIAVVDRVEGDRRERKEIPCPDGVLRTGVDAPGFYRVTAGGRSEWLVVPCARRESADLRGVRELPEIPPAPPWFRRVPYAVAAGLVMLLLFLLEWSLYQQGRI